MSDQPQKQRSAWQEANGNGWLLMALFVFCVTAGALIFGSNPSNVAENDAASQTTTR